MLVVLEVRVCEVTSSPAHQHIWRDSWPVWLCSLCSSPCCSMWPAAGQWLFPVARNPLGGDRRTQVVVMEVWLLIYITGKVEIHELHLQFLNTNELCLDCNYLVLLFQIWDQAGSVESLVLYVGRLMTFVGTVLTSSGSEKSGRSGTRTPTRAHTTMSTVHTPSTTTGQSAISSA